MDHNVLTGGVVTWPKGRRPDTSALPPQFDRRHQCSVRRNGAKCGGNFVEEELLPNKNIAEAEQLSRRVAPIAQGLGYRPEKLMAIARLNTLDPYSMAFGMGLERCAGAHAAAPHPLAAAP